MNTKPNKQEGSVLIVAMTAVVAVVAVVGIAVTMTVGTARITQRSQNLAIVKSGAEGSIEYAYGLWRSKVAQMDRAIAKSDCDTLLTTTQTFPGLVYTTSPSSLDGALSLTPADQYGVPTDTPTPVIVDVPGYPGWHGKIYLYMAKVHLASTLLPGKQVEYGIKRYFSYSEVPLFQSMFFFEHDIEIFRPATMIVSGLTHTNRYGFVSNDLRSGVNLPLTFTGEVSNVLGWSTAEPYQSTTWSGYASNANQQVTFANGMSSQLHNVARLEPLGREPASVLDTAPTGPLSPSGQLIGPDGDSDGNPNNDSMHELIDMPNTSSGYTDPPEIATRRLYTKASIVINIAGTTETITAKNGLTLTAAQITTIKNAVSETTIYDQREQANVHVSSLDISAVRTTLDALPSFNGVVYMVDTTTTTSSTPKDAVRLINGGQLPANGLTVASANGVYIQGDYNTGTTTNPQAVPSNVSNAKNTAAVTTSSYTRKPSAVIGDAVMILSNAWKDTNSDNDISDRVASNTTVNTAILAGFMPSGYTPTSGSQYGYSGGANNFPRFLEDWTDKYNTYTGSMVELFASTSFTGRWNTGAIYLPPDRCWNYDTMFDTNPPPGSVDAVAITRGTWARY